MFTNQANQPFIDWQSISTVLLDMDGTLRDKYYDDYFWEQFLPQVYGEQKGLNPEQAKAELFRRYKAVEKTLMWTDLNYWSSQLDLDIIALKKEVEHLIAIHPHVIDFLNFLNGSNKPVYLVTAAHRLSLEIKMNKVDLSHHFTRLICADEIGIAKEDVDFWKKLEQLLGFNRSQTMFADDNLNVLRAARSNGIKYLVHIAKPSSRTPVNYSDEFTSVAAFDELLIQVPN